MLALFVVNIGQEDWHNIYKISKWCGPASQYGMQQQPMNLAFLSLETHSQNNLA
jgi:hypothetical protein